MYVWCVNNVCVCVCTLQIEIRSFSVFVDPYYVNVIVSRIMRGEILNDTVLQKDTF